MNILIFNILEKIVYRILMKFLNFLKYRLIFLYKYKTLKNFVIQNNEFLILPSSKGIYKMKRFCPHQNAPLEKAFKKDNIIICHWHGCKMQINKKGVRI